MNKVEEAYYIMAHTLNSESNYDEIVKSIANALESLIQFINTGLPTNNFMVYNILLVAKLFIRANEKKYYYIDSIETTKRLLSILTSEQYIGKNIKKR